METFRRIVEVTNGSISLDLPQSFREGEVTVRSAKGMEPEAKCAVEKTGKDHPLAKFVGCIPDFPDVG